MTKEDLNGEAAPRLRIRVVGAFSPVPAGRVFSISATTFADALARTELRPRVTLADRLGGGVSRTLQVELRRIGAFQLVNIVGATPVLASLRELADELGGATPPPAAAVLERIRGLVGDGPLWSMVDAALRQEAARASGVSVDEFLDGGVRPPASSAIEAVVRSIRPGSATRSTVARAARRSIEEAIYTAAGDVLRDDGLARLEAAWRGLKLLADQCPCAAATSIEVVDVSPADVVDALAAGLPDAEVDRPDLHVVVDPCDDVSGLRRLAEAAEGALAPVLVSISPRFFGVEDAAAIASTAEEPDGGLPEAWADLRADEASRWLCVVANRAATMAEGHGPARRTSFSSPALAVSAMLAASFRETRSFARILGSAGALQAPATHELRDGGDAGLSIPTEVFFSIGTQQRLASLGLLGVGSGRNTARLSLSVAPMARGSTDALPLPAQIMSGRIVRLARWVRDEVPPSCTDAEAAALFEQAAEVLLFARIGGGATLRAGVRSAPDGRRVVDVQASVGPRPCLDPVPDGVHASLRALISAAWPSRGAGRPRRGPRARRAAPDRRRAPSPSTRTRS